MLRARIIPSLLVRNKGLVKTVRFKDGKYVGDPINAVKIFNEKEVDELAVFDIDATVQKIEPDYRMLENIANECRMPLCYGGGIKNSAQAKRILGLGVEKVAVSSEAILNPEIISDIADEVGNQSVVVVLDIKKKLLGKNYEVFIHNGKVRTGKNPFSLIPELEKQGAGEIIFNSIDNDGVMKGYDLYFARKAMALASVPMTFLGGAGSLTDIQSLVREHNIVGAAAGSLFVFKGVYKAVLINYPRPSEKRVLLK